MVDKNSEIAATLLSKFFPPLPPYLGPRKETCYNQLRTPAITEDDIQNAIFQACPLKGPACDRIPALVWQKTWPVLKGYSVPLFQSSLRQEKLPNAWKIAKILPLKKPNKGNYALPGTYRPISLLLTLSKPMEYLIAQKIAHLSDAYNLLLGKSLWWFEMQDFKKRSTKHGGTKKY